MQSYANRRELQQFPILKIFSKLIKVQQQQHQQQQELRCFKLSHQEHQRNTMNSYVHSFAHGVGHGDSMVVFIFFSSSAILSLDALPELRILEISLASDYHF